MISKRNKLDTNISAKLFGFATENCESLVWDYFPWRKRLDLIALNKSAVKDQLNA